MPGGHAWSADGITWSNMGLCNGEFAREGCFNLTRPYTAANGSVASVSYYSERPKLLLDSSGTPIVLYGTVCSTGRSMSRYSWYSPMLGTHHAWLLLDFSAYFSAPRRPPPHPTRAHTPVVLRLFLYVSPVRQ